MCLAVTCLHFGKNDRDLSRATVVIGDGTDTKIKSAQTADPGKVHSSAAPAGTQTHNLSIASPAL